jgi:hypothetical protein
VFPLNLARNLSSFSGYTLSLVTSLYLKAIEVTFLYLASKPMLEAPKLASIPFRIEKPSVNSKSPLFCPEIVATVKFSLIGGNDAFGTESS